MSHRFVSQSQMKSWNKCKRRYYLDYVRRVRKVDFSPSALSLGQYVHTGFEFIEEDWQEAMQALVDEDMENTPEILHNDVKNQHELARIMVEGLAEWIPTSPVMAGFEVLEREKEIAVDFGSYAVMGKVDWLVRLANEDVSILDLKTAADFRIFKLSDIDLQFRSYIALLEIIYGAESPMMGTWLVARKVKRTARARPPFYDTKSVTYNQHQLDSVKRYWDATVLPMHHAEDLHASGNYHQDMLFPPNPSYDCGLCPHRDLCPMFDSGDDAEGFIKDCYEESEPNARYGDVKILAIAEPVK